MDYNPRAELTNRQPGEIQDLDRDSEMHPDGLSAAIHEALTRKVVKPAAENPSPMIASVAQLDR